MINAMNNKGAKIIREISVVEKVSLFNVSEKMRFMILNIGPGAKQNCMSIQHTTNI